MKTLSKEKEDRVQWKHPEQVFLLSGSCDGAKEERSGEGSQAGGMSVATGLEDREL